MLTLRLRLELKKRLTFKSLLFLSFIAGTSSTLLCYLSDSVLDTAYHTQHMVLLSQIIPQVLQPYFSCLALAAILLIPISAYPLWVAEQRNGFLKQYAACRLPTASLFFGKALGLLIQNVLTAWTILALPLLCLWDSSPSAVWVHYGYMVFLSLAYTIFMTSLTIAVQTFCAQAFWGVLSSVTLFGLLILSERWPFLEAFSPLSRLRQSFIGYLQSSDILYFCCGTIFSLAGALLCLQHRCCNALPRS